MSGLTHDSDRGSQYCGHALQSALRRNGNDCSMSRKGNRRDNAVALSFFATLKKDPEHQCEYAAPEAARASVFEYIEVFCKPIRRLSFLGAMSPRRYEEQASASLLPHQKWHVRSNRLCHESVTSLRAANNWLRGWQLLRELPNKQISCPSFSLPRAISRKLRSSQSQRYCRCSPPEECSTS